jgi:hypothetical protein
MSERSSTQWQCLLELTPAIESKAVPQELATWSCQPLAQTPVGDFSTTTAVSEMIEYKDQNFRKLYDRGDALCLENMHFERCLFESCALSLTKDVHLRSTVRNVSVKNCTANDCGIGPAIFENVEIDGLATNDLLIVWAAMFRHVKLAGDIGKVKINSWAHFVDRTEATQGPFTRSREAYYQSIDWALDISEARFKGFDAAGIPAHLYRRDPESQAVVTRERVAAENGQRIAQADGNPWLPWIRGALSDGSSDGVLVTPLGATKKKRDEFLHGLRQLRDLGITEPD